MSFRRMRWLRTNTPGCRRTQESCRVQAERTIQRSHSSKCYSSRCQQCCNSKSLGKYLAHYRITCKVITGRRAHTVAIEESERWDNVGHVELAPIDTSDLICPRSWLLLVQSRFGWLLVARKGVGHRCHRILQVGDGRSRPCNVYDRVTLALQTRLPRCTQQSYECSK